MIRVRIESNFIIHGLEGESLVVEETSSVRQLLETISRLSEERYVFFAPGQDTLDPDDWEVDVNGRPYNGNRTESELPLRDGDAVSIRLMMYAGG